jgi:hypothetical protein
MDAWVIEKMNKKQYENFSLQKCIEYLGSDSIYLHDYDILCIGNKNNQKHFVRLKILASSPNCKVLQGPHEIVMYYREQYPLRFWVWSLTTLRKKFFEFSDRLSFERSSFLILPGPQILLRLKCVRSTLRVLRKIPVQMKKQYSEDFFNTLSQSTFDSLPVPMQTKRPREISLRSKIQQQHFLEQSFTSYIREYENTPFTKQEVFQKFQQDILKSLSQLDPQKGESVASIPTTISNQEIEPQNEELYELEF